MRQSRRTQKKIIRFYFFLSVISFILFVSIGFCIYYKIGVFEASLNKKVDNITALIHKKRKFTKAEVKRNDKLTEVVQKSLADANGNYGIVVINLQSDEFYFFNEHKQFKSASLYKLWVMATVFREMEKGTIKEDDVLSDNLESLYKKFNLATGSGELKDQTVSLTVRDALSRMITLSDNNASLLLTSRVTLRNVSNFLQDYQLFESHLGTNTQEPVTTAADVGTFLMRLYIGDMANKENTEKMISLLKQQQINNKIPKYLPPGTIVAHKTGELYGFSHDAGIVYLPKEDYFTVFLTDTTAPGLAEENIATTSKAIYDYFTNSKVD